MEEVTSVDFRDKKMVCLVLLTGSSRREYAGEQVKTMDFAVEKLMKESHVSNNRSVLKTAINIIIIV